MWQMISKLLEKAMMKKLKKMYLISTNVTCSSCFSCVKHNIWEPTMLAQDWRVNTVRIKGSVSPCRCTMEAIWITGSFSASGKIPEKRRLTEGSNFAFAFHEWKQNKQINRMPPVIVCVLCHTNAIDKETCTPFLPAHSMSKLRTRSGAILCQSPSAGWLIRSVHPTSTSYWHKDTWWTNVGRS